MTVRRSLFATLVGRERNSAERIADPAGLATSEYGGVTRNGERQVGIEVMGLARTSGSPLNVRYRRKRSSALTPEVWQSPAHRCR
jgi:hypothetical protein